MSNGMYRRIGMRPFQFGVVMLCMLLNMLDGYDIFVMGFALPHLPEGFASASEKGYLISAALVGMGVGAMLIARVADIFGRRLTLLVALVVNTISLVASAKAHNYETLLVGRFVTGVAIGTISVVVVVLLQEIAPPSRRNLAIGLGLFGFPLGSTVAGISGATLIAISGGSWQGLFWIGTAISMLLFVITYTFMPESVAFLRKQGTPEALRRADALLSRIDLEDENEHSSGTEPDSHAKDKIYLLGRDLRWRTLFLWTGYTCLTAAYYFVGAWTPQLITDASGNEASGALVGIMISVGTLLATITFGLVGLRRPAVQIACVFPVIAMIAIVAFSVSLQGAFALMMACLMGLCIYGGITAFTATATATYPILSRAKGYGTMLGVGRIGAVVSPIIAGYALTVMSPQAMYLSVTVPLALSAAAAFGLLRISRSRVAEACDAEKSDLDAVSSQQNALGTAD
ncbi:MFS transporter [Rhodococcus erythropolis]|uniref:MFS transporter n=1 Tax=Rhodococcus erythropolis TaxID=1833 RepID=UPI00381C505D